MDCVTTMLAVKSSVARRSAGAKSSPCIFEVEAYFNFDIRLQVRRTLVPPRHHLLASLRAGLTAIAMVVMATVITACSNGQAEAPPPPPPEVDAAQVVTKSVRQWDEFTGRI